MKFNVIAMTKEEIKQERSSTTAENAWLDLQVDDRLSLPKGLATVTGIFQYATTFEVQVVYDSCELVQKTLKNFIKSVSGGFFCERCRGEDGHFVSNYFMISSLKLPEKAVITEDKEKLFYIEEIEKLDKSLAYMHYVKKFDIKQLKTVYCMLKDFGGTVWKKDEYEEKFRIYINNGFKFANVCKKDANDWEIDGISTYKELRSRSNRTICEELEQGILKISFYYDVIANDFHWETEPFKVCEKLFEKIKLAVKELTEPQKDAPKSEHTRGLDKLNETKEKEVKEMETKSEVLSIEYSKAIALNHKIKVNSTVMVNVMYELGSQLMEMRDKKLFKELGYKSFKDYIASEVPLARTQSYACITIAENLSEEFVRSSEQIGVKKLEILAKLDEPQREQLQETVNLEDITVKQLQEEVKKLKSENAELKETVSSTNDLVVSVQNANAVLKAQNSEKVKTLNEQIEQLENQVKELENRPIEIAIKEDTETSREISNLKREIKAREESIKRLEDDMTTATQDAYKKGLEVGKNNSNQNDAVFELVTDNFEDAFLKYFSVIRKNENPKEWAEKIENTLKLFDNLRNETLGEKSNE